MTVLVTGGCGYIGAHVVHALHEAGEDVVVVDDLSYGKPNRIGNARLYGMDIATPGAGERLAEIMEAENVDSVIHFAARKQVGESVEKPLWYYQQNINGMLNVLEGMKEAGVKKLVFSSSAATYGVPPVDVVPEDVEPMVPINPYGQTKLFGEWMARACEQPYGIRFCGLRYFNVAGCGPVQLEDPAILNLIPMLFDRLKQGKAPAIFGDDYPTPDGTCVRDYIHVSDLADAHIAALKYLDRDERKYDVFNVGTGEGTSVRQIVDEVKKVTGLPFKETVMGRRAGDPPHLIGSPSASTPRWAGMPSTTSKTSSNPHGTHGRRTRITTSTWRPGSRPTDAFHPARERAPFHQKRSPFHRSYRPCCAMNAYAPTSSRPAPRAASPHSRLCMGRLPRSGRWRSRSHAGPHTMGRRDRCRFHVPAAGLAGSGRNCDT